APRLGMLVPSVPSPSPFPSLVSTVANQRSWGPTICGEWSQADTDCTQFINNVGVGARWTGTMNTGNASTSVLDPRCPTAETGPSCTCDEANADPSTYSA